MKLFRVFAAALAVLLPVTLAAQTQNAAKVRPSAPKTGFRAEFLAGLDEVQEKITALVNATPESKWNWRPAEGVRSFGEVYGHIAGGNYFLATFLGVQAPSDVPKDLEKITDKQKMLAELKRSFDHLRNAITVSTDAELEKSVKMFGSQTSGRGVYITILNHLHEHLGQGIAYARMNGITPPWSR